MTTTSRWTDLGLRTLHALCLIIGGLGLLTGLWAYMTLGHYESRIEELELENVQLKQTASKAHEQGVQRHELTLIVKDQQADGTRKTRALQNRNYLNIKKLGVDKNGVQQKWEGQIGVDEFGHVIFRDALYSVRAGALTLSAYEKRHGINTVEGLVKRFSESNHDKYIEFICKRLGVNRNDKISLTQKLPELLKAMIAFESGMKIGDEYVDFIASLRL